MDEIESGGNSGGKCATVCTLVGGVTPYKVVRTATVGVGVDVEPVFVPAEMEDPQSHKDSFIPGGRDVKGTLFKLGLVFVTVSLEIIE